MKKLLSIMLTLSLAFSLTVCNVCTVSAATKPTKMTLSVSSKTIEVFDTFNIKVKKVTPKKASKSVTYKSNNKNIAKVSNKGVVTGTGIGSTTITVTSKKNKKLVKKVKVTVKCSDEDMKTAINSFNSEKSRIEDSLLSRDKAIEKAEKQLNKKGTPLFPEVLTELKDAIQSAKDIKFNVPKITKDLSVINEAIELLKAIDYTKQIQTVLDLTANVKDQFARYDRLIVPSEADVIAKLSGVDNIGTIAAVTEEHDPNGKLNKQGGYYSQIYFEDKRLNLSNIDVIDEGTSCGGSIEMYKTLDRAIDRNRYLGTFDGTVLSNGSHYVFGTIIIRISDELTATQQLQMTKDIVYAISEP